MAERNPALTSRATFHRSAVTRTLRSQAGLHVVEARQYEPCSYEQGHTPSERGNFNPALASGAAKLQTLLSRAGPQVVETRQHEPCSHEQGYISSERGNLNPALTSGSGSLANSSWVRHPALTSRATRHRGSVRENRDRIAGPPAGASDPPNSRRRAQRDCGPALSRLKIRTRPRRSGSSSASGAR